MNVLLVATAALFGIVAALYLAKPSFIFNADGRLRELGVGTRHKTILPLWIVVFLIAVFSYSFAYMYCR